MHRRLAPLARALLAAGAAACASAPPTPGVVTIHHPPDEEALRLPAPEARLDEAARLLADGYDLDRAGALLASVPAEAPRRALLEGQLAELRGDDASAEQAYGRYLAGVEDDEVRLRRALALERLGRGEEAEEDLARLRPAPAPPREQPGLPARRLRPLKPSAR
jgi:hypothetical protein